MILHLRRDVFTDSHTMGELRVDYGDGRGSQWFGWTVEDTDRGLHMCDSLEHIGRVKVPGKTCIPVGFYRLELVDSPKYGPDTLSLVDVPGFRYIRVHSGNSAEDTDGCILAGMERNVATGNVWRSSVATSWLEDTLRPLIKGGEPCYMLIERDPAAWTSYRA